MSTPAPPFVNFKNQVANNIGSTPTIIFQESYASLLDSVWITNAVENQINLTFYILKEVDSQPEITDIRYVTIEPYDSIDILKGSTWTVEYGDLLFGYSDFSANRFNSFISYRALTELGG